jgi:transmembrane sensor
LKADKKVKKEEKAMKDENWEIIAKYLAKEELSTEEKSDLEQIKSDQEINVVSKQSADVFEKTDLFFNLKKYDTEKAWENVNNQLNQKRKNLFQISWMYQAAAIVILMVATTATIWLFSNNNQKYKEFATSAFDLSNPEIELPDGTKVKLNHSSKLTYPSEFSRTNRVVNLTGEAFFNVTPDLNKPFTIKTNSASVMVLGTSFNIYAYSESSTVEVIVSTGKVELIEPGKSKKTDAEKILLLPGEKGTFDKLNRTLLKEKSINPNNLSWYTHEIEFKYSRLADVFQTLQRIYNIQITTGEGVDLDQKLSATFSQQQASYILEVICMTQNLNLKKTSNNQYTIRNK